MSTFFAIVWMALFHIQTMEDGAAPRISIENPAPQGSWGKPGARG